MKLKYLYFVYIRIMPTLLAAEHYYVLSRLGVQVFSETNAASKAIANIPFGSMVFPITDFNKVHFTNNGCDDYWILIYLDKDQQGFVRHSGLCSAKQLITIRNWHIGWYVSRTTWNGSDREQYLFLDDHGRFRHSLATDVQKRRISFGTYLFDGKTVVLRFSTRALKFAVKIDDEGFLFLESMEPLARVGMESRILLRGPFEFKK